MIGLSRNFQAPSSLSHPASLKQLAEAAAYYESWTPGQSAFHEFTRYKQEDVRHALFLMSNGKCAYCEMRIEKGTFEIEHYRPKGRVSGCDHPGYWWLALEWTNLLPTCPACNKGFRQHVVTADMSIEEVESLHAQPRHEIHGKASQFPVLNSRLNPPMDDHFEEGPLLIDPTRTDPEPELKWRSDCSFSVVEPADTDTGPSLSGAATIACVALNRVDLVVNRTQVLRWLKTQRIRIMDALEATAGSGISREAMVAAIEKAKLVISIIEDAGESNQEFSGMVRSFLQDLKVEFEQMVLSRE
ncbi:UNVERIFIED_CONTAM: hypothetical protein Q9R71_21750 [Actinomycetes bacterium ARC8]|nr:hypothetical protein [Actinomycetes bacterium ARC8]